MKNMMAQAAALATCAGVLFAQEPITLDLSQMKGCPVAMGSEPMTNHLVLYEGWIETFNATNAYNVVFDVDGVVEQLREQGDITNLVTKLVKSGDVCAVVGHKWARAPHVTLEYRPDGEYPEHRMCILCGKAETKYPGVWK